MLKTDSILGMNARNRLYLVYNPKKGRRIADSKLLTKKRLQAVGIPTPQVLAVFKTAKDIFDFNWLTLPDNFVLKPCSGYGGQGVVVVKKKAKWAGEWRLMDDSVINVADLRLWALNILAGEYSLHNLPDFAFVEERIKIRKIFWRYAYQGTPDIRVIVFNKVPVLAMLRLPTPESQGKANLHQGAIGVGIDVATGITGFGICRGKIIKEIPWTKRKINGLKIPFWNIILTLAVRCQEKIPELGFAGVDIVLDKDRGPMVLELNARPGLEIQNANLIPLKRRLERVEGLEVINAEHGMRIAKALFAGRYADRIMAQEGLKILKTSEEIKVISPGKKAFPVSARIDTGAFRSSIDKGLAKKLGLLKKTNILWREGEKYAYRSAQGRQSRPIIAFNFWLAGRKIKSSASVADRTKVKHLVLIGRNDLGGFLVRA
jgi:alpha-L-glutamate ligase-like protein